MKNLFDELDNAVAALGSVSAALSKLKFRLREFIMTEKPLDDEVERLLSFSGDLPNGSPANDRRSGQSVAEQFYKFRKSVIGTEQKKEGKDDMKLKYGQGCITLKTRERKDGSIYKIYEGRFYDEYGKIKSVYAKTKIECYNLLKKVHFGNNKTYLRKSYETVKDWVLEWYNTFKKKSIRASTRRNYETAINNYIIPGVGKYKLNAITGEVLQRFFNTIEAGNTRKKTLTLLTACFEKAVILKKMKFNECKAVEIPKYKKKKRRPFTYDEQDRITYSENQKISKIFTFLCCTGLRVGEFLALTKEDFFFEERFFKVDKALTIDGEPKTDSSNRVVYFLDELINDFDFDLLGKYTYSGLRIGFDRLMKSLNIKGVSLHCTRHTFATVCHSLGMNDKVLQSLLGHSTLSMTQDVYMHLLKKGTSKIRNYLQAFCAFMCTTI